MKSYYTVNGRIRGESSGGVNTDYFADALGSVMATVNSAAAVQNTYRYKPYGELLAKTGVDADPRFRWVGARGYRRAIESSSLYYVRLRHFHSLGASWTSVDPLWPRAPSYIYTRANPTGSSDPTGAQQGPCCCIPTGIDIKDRKLKRDEHVLLEYAPPLGTLDFPHFSGAIFHVLLNWKHQGTDGDIKHCAFSWREKRTALNPSNPDHNRWWTYQDALAGSNQQTMWDNCKKTYRQCSNGNCSILDSPGLLFTDEYVPQGMVAAIQQTYRHEICMELTLTSSCLQRADLPVAEIKKYFKFSRPIDWPYLGKNYSIHPSFVASDENCKVAAHNFPDQYGSYGEK